MSECLRVFASITFGGNVVDACAEVGRAVIQLRRF